MAVLSAQPAQGYLTPDQMTAALTELQQLRSLLGLAPSSPLGDGPPEVTGAALARAPTSNIGIANDAMGAGRDTGAILRPYQPGLRDRVGAMIAGTEGNETRGAIADMLVGTRGIGPQGPTIAGMRPSDFLGVGPAADYIDHSSRGEIGPAMASGAQAVLSPFAPGAGRIAGEIGSGLGYLTDAGRRGVGAVGEMIAARPAASTAAGATGAMIGSAPEAGEARTDHPDRPKPPAGPTPLRSFDDFLKERHATERAQIEGKGGVYGVRSQERTASRAQQDYDKLKKEYDKAKSAHDKDMEAWGTRVAQFDKDQAERDRQAEFKEGFSERHPIANAALVGAGYLAPFLIARRGGNALNAERAGHLSNFETALTARDPAAAGRAALSARSLENAPTTPWDAVKTAATVAAPAEAQSLARVIDLATTGKDTEAYKKAQDELTSADYYKKLIPQLMSGGVLYSMGGKLPLPGRLGLTEYDKGRYTSMIDDFVPRATRTEPRPGTFGYLTRERPVEPTPETTTTRIQGYLDQADAARRDAGIASADADRRLRAANEAAAGTGHHSHAQRRGPDGRFLSGP